MLKRLIEVALPLKEVSEESAREKSIRHGHISTLHIWWARRPLAACRAAVFASLIPDPDDPECPAQFRKLVMEVLSSSEFKPKQNGDGPVQDTARNRCLEFIKKLVKWENSNDSSYMQPAQRLISAAHKLLHPQADGHSPKVLDPFAGGGAIPLEALRLGCEAHALDLNPVAHLIELCTLVYPQKYGQPDGRPIPDYIKRLGTHDRPGKRKKDGSSLFEKHRSQSSEAGDAGNEDAVPDVDITEAEYRKNPLAADIRYWGQWIHEAAAKELARFYPEDKSGAEPVAYLWTRTVRCPNPQCGATIPLCRQLWLRKKNANPVALRMRTSTRTKKCVFEVVEGHFDFDPDAGTTQRGQAACPFCGTVASNKYLQEEGNGGRVGHQMMAVVVAKRGKTGRLFREPASADLSAVEAASGELDRVLASQASLIPSEPLKAWSGVFNAPLFGMTKWRDLFSSRQLLALATFARLIQKVGQILGEQDAQYAAAVCSILALNLDRLADLSNTLCVYEPIAQCPRHLFGRQAIPMVWDYAEGVPPSDRTCSWLNCLERTLDSLAEIWSIPRSANVVQGTVTKSPFDSSSLEAIVTDPPYYDAVPYSDLSDFFYVWLKRTVGHWFPQVFRTPLTPKTEELVSHLGNNYPGQKKVAADYERGMEVAFSRIRECLRPDGICCVMFAHKTTTAWEALIKGLLRSGLIVTASWPIHTEMKSRLRGMDSAALASSVSLICRKRAEAAPTGLWDDVRKELQKVAKERLDFFWSQGIRGADFFISAIGPALSVFGKYEKATRLSGEEVTVGHFLDEVRGLVTNYALSKILKTTHTSGIDPESRFYVIWKWSYGDAKVPADEAFKLAQALGMDTEIMWDRTGVLAKAGENVQAVTIEDRMAVRGLGERRSDGSPASIIDVLHRLCHYRERGDGAGLLEFLGRSGQGQNTAAWLVAQAVSEVLPDGDKEKQLMQGLLNQRDRIEDAARQGKLF